MQESLTTYQTATLFDIRTQADRFPRLRTIPAEKAINQLSAIVSVAHLYCGREIAPVLLNTTATAFYGELLQAYPLITLAEVERAVHDWITSSDVYAISVVTLLKAVRDFIGTEEFQSAINSADMREKRSAEADFEATAKFLEQHSSYARELIAGRHKLNQ